MSEVELRWPALKRAWRMAEYEELWLQFRPRDGWAAPARPGAVGTPRSSAALAAFEAAVQVANGVAESAAPGNPTFVEAVSAAEQGPVALMTRTGTEHAVRAWFETFAVDLAARGLAGQVTAAPHSSLPRWLGSLAQSGPQLTAFVSYRVGDLTQLDWLERQTGWNTPSELTRRVVRVAVDWGTFDRADVYLRRNLHQVRIDDPDVRRPLAEGVERLGMAAVTYLRPVPRRADVVAFSPQGHVCFGGLDSQASWRERLDHVVSALTALPAETDLAFVQYASAIPVSWDDIDSGWSRPPYVREHHVRYNRHLHTRYIADAHGVQILTDEHLSNARDLSAWVITSLGNGRHLVRAQDLAAWYADREPDPETLARARHDFGDLILTPETVAANPPPWA